MATKKTSKRTIIEPHKGDKRYVRRNKKGEFKSEVNVGRSLSADKKRTAKKTVPKGQGDRGDTKRGGSVVKRVLRKLTGG
ncbi:MAG: hypothetical protein ABI871_06925 [Chthoniobacterales bacterium]